MAAITPNELEPATTALLGLVASSRGEEPQDWTSDGRRPWNRRHFGILWGWGVGSEVTRGRCGILRGSVIEGTYYCTGAYNDESLVDCPL